MTAKAGRRILVCGGRDYDNASYMSLILDSAEPGVIIHGACTGADTLAGEWAKKRKVPAETYPVEHELDGPWPGAGPRRNLRMLVQSHPDLVIAFPGGKGTANMRALARTQGVEVVDVKVASIAKRTKA